MQGWMVERLAEEHRRDLMAPARSAGGMRSAARRSGGLTAPASAMAPVDLARADFAQAAATHDGHRPFGSHLGALLIRAGTRLGGATITTS